MITIKWCYNPTDKEFVLHLKPIDYKLAQKILDVLKTLKKVKAVIKKD